MFFLFMWGLGIGPNPNPQSPILWFYKFKSFKKMDFILINSKYLNKK